jgi:serine/threonine-protein kinase
MKCPKCHTDNPETKQFCADCGTKLSAARDAHPEVTETLQTPVRELTTGSTFTGRYQVIEELGKGGMGRVYKAFDAEIEEKIALKLLKPEIGIDEEMIERFRNELKLARKISQRNVCRMYDLNREEGAYYITMEYIVGEDLKRLIREVGQMSVGKTISMKDRVAAVRKLLGRGEVKIVEGADHMTTLTKPEFASAIIEFLRSGKPNKYLPPSSAAIGATCSKT